MGEYLVNLDTADDLYARQEGRAEPGDEEGSFVRPRARLALSLIYAALPLCNLNGSAFPSIFIITQNKYPACVCVFTKLRGEFNLWCVERSRVHVASRSNL